jgi:hypothetical protein
MLEVSLCVERGLQVSVVFPDPACHHGACIPRLVDWQIDWPFLSLFAQGPGGLVFARIGGSGVRGFLSRLVRSLDGLVFSLECSYVCCEGKHCSFHVVHL